MVYFWLQYISEFQHIAFITTLQVGLRLYKYEKWKNDILSYEDYHRCYFIRWIFFVPEGFIPLPCWINLDTVKTTTVPKIWGYLRNMLLLVYNNYCARTNLFYMLCIYKRPKEILKLLVCLRSNKLVKDKWNPGSWVNTLKYVNSKIRRDAEFITF